ncbi:hypothetical protein [Wolbachia pipientis]|uniref:Uncharacterized protein n=1 Tax=Wolbachia pipientis TaxID=955 RepID=A0A7G5CCL3_WOLPI|nr:hypothetical protein [Wolbachia pipientis]QMV46947.1 hypothetical protein HC356_02495 [Wolbachia pipientis]
MKVADTGFHPRRCHPSSLLFLSSQCLTLGSRRRNFNKWLHNKGWIPVPSTGMTPVALRHTAIHSRYLLA